MSIDLDAFSIMKAAGAAAEVQVAAHIRAHPTGVRIREGARMQGAGNIAGVHRYGGG